MQALASMQPPDHWTYTCGKYFDTVITICIMINIGTVPPASCVHRKPLVRFWLLLIRA